MGNDFIFGGIINIFSYLVQNVKKFQRIIAEGFGLNTYLDQKVTPSSWAMDFFEHSHDSILGGHQGIFAHICLHF